eukprot:g8254.t1
MASQSTMSKENDFDDVRKRVLQLARDIEQLSKSAIPPDEFFPKFLQMLVTALGARAGAVWNLGDGGRLGLTCEVRLAETGIAEDPQAGFKNQKLLTEVIQTGEAGAYSPDDASDVELPSQHLTILAALQVESDSVGVVQIFQRPDAPIEARPGFLQFVEQMTGYASRFLERRKKSAEAKAPEEFWHSFEQFSLQLQRSLDIEEVASTAASDGRLLLGCDRASVAFKRGRKVSIKAISGQGTVNPRANLVRSMVKVSSKVMKLGEPILYSGKVDNIAPQIEEPLAEFIQEGGSRMVMLLPLVAGKPLVSPGDDDEEQERKKKAKKPEVIGCLIIENLSDSELTPELASQAELVAEHSAAALSNARIHNRVMFLKTWKFFGRILEWFHGRKLAKTLAVLTIVAAVVASLILIPYDYRVEGKGKLMPVVQQEVFCPMDGEVDEIFVKSGQRVEKGQALFLLRNIELSEQLVTANKGISEKRAQIRALEARKDEATRNADARQIVEIDGQILETQEAIKGLVRQLVVLEKRKQRLTVRAPIAGTVATFQIRKLLADRPVRRGEKLIDIMDDRGKWHLELEVEEQRMGHLLRAQEKLNKKDLDVEFILATAAEETFDGKLKTRGAGARCLRNTAMDGISERAERLLADYDRRQPGSICSDGTVLSIDEAYRLQDAVAGLRQQRGERPAGFKVGCTSPVIRAQLGIEHAVSGRLWESERRQSGCTLPLSDFLHPAIEGELAVELAADLDSADPTGAEIISAIGSVFAVIELHHVDLSRPLNSAGELIAGNALHAGFVESPTRTEFRKIESARISIRVDDTEIDAYEGPLLTAGIVDSLRWLAGHLRRQGRVLSAGMTVLTGSLPRLIPLTSAARVVVDTSHFGSVTATFVE